MKAKMGMKSLLTNLVPFAAMLASQSLFTGITVISKAAMSQGMSNFVFVAYSDGLGACILILFVAPLIFLQRTNRPRLTFRLMGKYFIIGLTGITIVHNFTYIGILYSSPTLSAAISNLDPAFTFTLAVIFRMEKVDIRCFRSQIKILGTVFSIAGALIMTLYRGPALGTSLSSSAALPKLLLPSAASNWVFGGFCFLVVTLASATATIISASVLQEYPSAMAVVLFYNVFGAVQCSVVSLIAERHINAWKLRPDIELAAIICSGIGGAAVSCLTLWSMSKKGPVFVSMFGPLGIVIASLMSAIFLGDNLHVGSVVGAVVIVTGFYAVMWAKYKEDEAIEQCTDHLPSSSSQKIPLLQDQ